MSADDPTPPPPAPPRARAPEPGSDTSAPAGGVRARLERAWARIPDVWAARLRSLSLGLAIVGAALAVESWRAQSGALERVAVGELAPDSTFTLLAGGTTSLTALRGQVVVVVFWATWCPPCVREIPALAALHRDLEDDGLVVLGVSQDEGGAEDVRAFLEDTPIPYRLALDPSGAVGARWGLQLLPSLAVVDREGRVRWKTSGLTSESRLRGVIEPLL